MTSNFQSRSSKEGQVAQQLAETVLTGAGFTVLQREISLPQIGVPINFIARDKTGQQWLIIASGAFTADRSGLRRTDTVYKNLGRSTVAALNDERPILLLTTNLPPGGSTGNLALKATKIRVFFDALELTEPMDRRRLREYAERGRPKHPLPGFWTPTEIFGPAEASRTRFGARRSAPLSETGDPFGQIVDDPTVRALPHRIKVFVPSRDRNDRAIPGDHLEDVLGSVERLLIENAGGITSARARGHWVSPLGSVASEDVIALESYSERPMSDDVVDQLKKLVLDGLDQESFALVLDDTMYEFKRSFGED